jgi:hypothetical protein
MGSKYEQDLPPLPWSYERNAEGPGFVYLVDANGRRIGSLWGSPAERIATAEFCCNASHAAAAKTPVVL